jgi:ribose transport system substrate-binding protein
MYNMNKKIKIGLVMKSLQADFFREMKEGAENYAASRDDIELISVGTDTQTEVDIQIRLVGKLIASGVDAILLAPVDSKALAPVTVKAVKAGITVVNIDIRLDGTILAENGVSIPFVGPDNKSAAKTAGKILASRLNKKDKVILIEGFTGSENAQQRANGFKEIIKNYGLRLVAAGAADWETEKAATLFEKLYRKHPDIKGVFCSNDAMASGVIRILSKAKTAGRIPVVGFDNDASAQALLANGSLLATIDAYGSRMAIEGIEYALKIMNGGKCEDYSTPYSLIVSELI